VNEWLETPDWAARNATVLNPLLAATTAASRQKVAAARNRLVGYGLEAGVNEWAFRGILGEGQWMRSERQLLAEFNVTWFAELLAVPGLESVFESNFADSNLFAPEAMARRPSLRSKRNLAGLASILRHRDSGGVYG
jgi:hypothetical protein